MFVSDVSPLAAWPFPVGPADSLLSIDFRDADEWIALLAEAQDLGVCICVAVHPGRVPGDPPPVPDGAQEGPLDRAAVPDHLRPDFLLEGLGALINRLEAIGE